MRFTLFRTSTILVASLILSPATIAADLAYDWLMKMNRATRQLNYDGTFVYQHDGQLEAMRIVHSVEEGSVRERLVSLNGAAREVIRDDRQVMCYLPDRKSVVVEHRLTREKSFPVILPERVRDLGKNYSIELGRPGRVVGRDAQLVIIKPRDVYRYGYHLWADRESGLLLKADLVDHMDNTLEQFMFTQVDIGRTIEAADLQPAVAGDRMVWYWGKTMDTAVAEPVQGWSAGRLPSGFMLSNYMMRKNPTRNKFVEHLVYSDGLAAVSVFIEKLDRSARSAVRGASRMGAVHAYGKVLNAYQIIAVGEVPAATVELIGKSVSARP